MKGSTTEAWTALSKPTGLMKHPGAGKNRKLLLHWSLMFMRKVLLLQNPTKDVAAGKKPRGTQGLLKLHLRMKEPKKINTSVSYLTQISCSSLPLTDVRGQRHLSGAVCNVFPEQAREGERMNLEKKTESNEPIQQ